MNTEYNKTEYGTITIQVECPLHKAERYRQIIPILILNGTLNIKGGRAIIHFDSEGDLLKIEHEYIQWTRKFKNDIIDIIYKTNPT